MIYPIKRFNVDMSMATPFLYKLSQNIQIFLNGELQKNVVEFDVVGGYVDKLAEGQNNPYWLNVRLFGEVTYKVQNGDKRT